MLQPPLFPFGRPAEGADFIGREADLLHLTELLDQGTSVLVTAPAGFGKTSLMHALGAKLKDDSRTSVVTLSLLGCRSEAAVLDAVREAIRTTLPETLARDQSARAVICLDDVEALVGASWLQETPKNLSGTFALFGDPRAEALLGQGELLHEGEHGTGHPFGHIHLEPIPAAAWVPYLTTRFAAAGKTLPPECAHTIVASTDGIPAHVRHLAWHVGAAAREVVTAEDVRQAEVLVRRPYLPFWKTRIGAPTPRQRNLLRAVAAGHTKGLCGSLTLDRFELGTSSTVQRSREALIGKGLLYRDPTGGLAFTDPMFRGWVKETYAAR